MKHTLLISLMSLGTVIMTVHAMENEKTNNNKKINLHLSALNALRASQKAALKKSREKQISPETDATIEKAEIPESFELKPKKKKKESSKKENTNSQDSV